jgi:aldehyde:ferredoxin oxidoreductase
VKAIVVEGEPDVEVADPEQLSALRRELVEAYQKDAWVSILRSGGTAWGTGWAFDLNDVPVKNWQVEAHDWREEGQRITGQAMDEAGFVVGRTTCFRCPIACRRTVRIDEGPWPVAESAGPEYETVGALGAMLMVDDVRALCKANELCNRYGMDTITTGGTIAWAIEAFEREELTPEQTGGRQLTWGDPQLLLDLIEEIARNEGVGSLLSQGSRGAARATGKRSDEYAIQVKGLELAMHHPRAMRGLDISYATGPRGASHNEGGSIRREGDVEEKAREIQFSVNQAQINGSAVFCNFTVGPLDSAGYASVLTAVTGHPYDEEDLQRFGERIWHLRRAFNLRHAQVAGEKDTLPRRVLEQLPPEPAFEDLLAAYYRVRGVDEDGVSRRETLEALGLEDVADDLGL